jgi:Peptidase of plants and bacteria
MRNLGDIAALATVTGDDASADRVVIAPSAFGRLNRLGRRVVLTHELVHVAMGGARDTRTPMWLIEGLADYVGYKGTGVTVGSAARELAAVVRSGALPSAPPERDAFTDSGDRLSAAYEEAWLACRMIAERYGEPTLVRLYRTAQAEPGDAGDPRIEERALHAVLGIGQGEFDARWRAYVREKLG